MIMIDNKYWQLKIIKICNNLRNLKLIFQDYRDYFFLLQINEYFNFLNKLMKIVIAQYMRL